MPKKRALYLAKHLKTQKFKENYSAYLKKYGTRNAGDESAKYDYQQNIIIHSVMFQYYIFVQVSFMNMHVQTVTILLMSTPKEHLNVSMETLKS